jgi:hypothetical protein
MISYFKAYRVHSPQFPSSFNNPTVVFVECEKALRLQPGLAFSVAGLMSLLSAASDFSMVVWVIHGRECTV